METRFETLKQQHYIVLGDIMLDAYQTGRVTRISPEAPVPIIMAESISYSPGGAANVAMNIKKLGASVSVIGVAGKDDSGEKLVALLSTEGIDTTCIYRVENRKTTQKTRIVSKGQQLLRIDDEVTTLLDDEWKERIYCGTKELVERGNIRGLIIEDYNKGMLDETVVEKVLALCKRHQIPVYVDPKYDNFWSYKEVDLFKPNLTELERALGKKIVSDETSSLEEADREIREKLHHKITLLTLAEKGMYIHDGKKGTLIPTEVKQLADVSGAGDTVISVAALMMGLGKNPEEAARIANIAAGIVCSKPGVYAIEKEELLKILFLHPHF